MSHFTGDARGSEIALPEVKLNIRTPRQPGMATVVRNELATSRKAAGYVRHIEIDLTGSGMEGTFLPGQVIGVIADGLDANGTPPKVRLYSICSPTRGEDGKGVIIATTVKRLIDENWETGKLLTGVSSNFLCDRRPGDKIKVTGPVGKRFLLPIDRSAHDYVFFATGTGIAPFRGFIIDLLESGCTSQICLVMGSAYSTDLLYHADLLRMQEQHMNFQYITAISRERQDDGHDPLYVHDRLRTERDWLLPMLINPRTLIYICGVAGMEMGIFQQLALQLTGADLRQYLDVDPAALADIRNWTGAMIPKQVRPTRRVFMEVYT